MKYEQSKSPQERVWNRWYPITVTKTLNFNPNSNYALVQKGTIGWPIYKVYQIINRQDCTVDIQDEVVTLSKSYANRRLIELRKGELKNEGRTVSNSEE